MNIAIAGLGLIGGSMALAAKRSGFAQRVVGVDVNLGHCRTALHLGIADEITDLPSAVKKSALIILSIPADAILNILPQVLNLIQNDQVVFDTASVKGRILATVQNHANRKRFVATHPMWGTEHSGPEAATLNSFKGLVNVICEADKTAPDALMAVEKFYAVLGMRNVYMDAAIHDMHVAYVSHIAHLSSFSLANTVLAKENQTSKIFELASGGFESTVRLAKSNPEMWVDILMQNKTPVLEVLQEHIHQLGAFQACILNEDREGLAALIKNANRIKKVLNQ